MTSLKRNIDDNNNNSNVQSLKISKHDHDSNITATIDHYFYSIWRNTYTRRCIRNSVLQNKEIKLFNLDNLVNKQNFEYLNNNHQYLSLLSDQDKLDYNIFFKLVISNQNLDQLSNNSYKHLINSIHIITKEKTEINCDLVHDGVVKLVCNLQTQNKCIGRLPQSLKFLTFVDLYSNNYDIDQVLLHLPSNLRNLVLPKNYKFKCSQDIGLPPSLEVFKFYSSVQSSLGKIVVPPQSNRVYKDVCAKVSSNDFEWLQNQNWIIDIQLHGGNDRPIPSHIKKVGVHKMSQITEHTLPRGLESLYVSEELVFPISFIRDMPYLKHLDIENFDIKLEKGMLPLTLESIYLCSYNQQIELDVLPPGLTKLQLMDFNQELQVGVLPQSLKILQMVSYKHILKPFVLPNKLKTLWMQNFNQPLESNTLPTSLVRLKLNSHKLGTFKDIDQLNKLKSITVHSLTPSISRVIANCNNIIITFNDISQDLDLRDTQIEHLQLWSESTAVIPLLATFIPSHLKSLKLKNLRIEYNNIIPSSCLYLESDQKKFQSFINSSNN